MMNVLNETSKEYGMKINIKKTKVMRMSRTEGAKAKIQIDGNSLEQVMEYCYLGSTVTSDGKCHKDVRKRIAMGKNAFNKRSELLRGKLSLQLKKRMVKSLIWSVTLYASETWTLRKEDIKRLEAFEMWIWRRIERISWMDHWKNVDVLLLVDERRSLIDTIRQRQKNWIGHILRGESLLRTVLEGRIPGKKTRGRPRMMLLDWMMDGGRKMNYGELKKKSSNRQYWRQWNPEPASGQST